ncbi:hypothetical protein [Mesorhizobium sp. ORM16]|uniref:hypothetical protein n=1 Tax=Mesorhizobium sp. ORM16 TaxID=3376989 RepID=UPI003857F19A
MSADKLIERLRAGLAGTTKGPWRHYTAPLRSGMTVINEVQCDERAPVVAWAGFDDSFRSKAKHTRNAAHIARCSPDNIRALLDLLASIQADNLRLREALEAIRDERGICVTCGELADAKSNCVGCDESQPCRWGPRDPRAVAARSLSQAGEGEQ